MSAPTRLLAVPNVSEGRRKDTIEAIAGAFTADGNARLLDVHSDVDHHRSVLTLVGEPGGLGRALLAGAREAVQRIDVGQQREPREIGQHPHVGAVDVMPVVYLDARARGAACAEALVLAHEIGEQLEVPVFLYGALAGGRSRAEIRRGGVGMLAQRMREGVLRPDFGPERIHPSAGATLVSAREPLVAFNLELAPPATVADARRIAATIREGGALGLPGLRAIGVALGGRGSAGACGAHDAGGTAPDAIGSPAPAPAPSAAVDRLVAQVSMNVEQPLELPLREIVEAVRRHAEVVSAEVVGLAPRAALEGFPRDLAMPGFDPQAQVIENALGF